MSKQFEFCKVVKSGKRALWVIGVTHVLSPGPTESVDDSARAVANASKRPIVIPVDVKFNADATCCNVQNTVKLQE